jgi:hypothetical protein
LVEVSLIAVLAYVPFIASSPGQVTADTKQYLYLDPGRYLARTLSLWDPHVAAGTVPHQQIGYLFPMGPYYWLMHWGGVPDWVAQRVWLGTISLLAALGARWLFRMLGTRPVGALAGALVYMLTPYQLAFTARMSVLLLAWAGLPWLVGLTMRSVRYGGWRDPALFALVILAVGGVNASAPLFVLVAPALWIVVEFWRGREAAVAALRAASRILVLSVGVSVWWAVGLALQGSYGLPVLQLTESVRTVASASSPLDLLRGIGNWFFYGSDGLGRSIDQAADYTKTGALVYLSFGVPVLALASAAIVRWRHRAYFVLLVIVGTVIGVGAWPYDDASPYGRLWKFFANGSSLGLALRNTPRVVPVIVLGMAALLAAGVSALATRRLEFVAGGIVAVFALGALLPVWSTGFLSQRLQRPEAIPGYWTQAAAALERGGNSTRVFEIPGANFSAYRWGNTVEPITPGLIDRPYLAREVLPYGSPQTVDLLDAVDRRMQEGIFEPSSLAPVSRLFGVGTVALRSDLQYERFGLPRPQTLWAALTQPLPEGLLPPARFGPDAVTLPFVDNLALNTSPSVANPPSVALFNVRGAVPIVHTAPTSEPVVLAGDGEGIVDAAAAGLLDGHQLVLESASLTTSQLHEALKQDADVVLTDSNRRRTQSWFATISHNNGATERAGQTSSDPDGQDYRLDVFPGSGDSARTVVEQREGTVDATVDGGTARPEDRAVHAFDGDLRTAWRVGGDDTTGVEIRLHTDRPVHTDHVTLVQPQNGPRDRTIRKVELTFDHGAPVTTVLGQQSLGPAGERVDFPARAVRTLTVKILATTSPLFGAAADPVGFAEIRLGGVRVEETVRLPVDLPSRSGGTFAGHNLDVVLSRLRSDPSDPAHQDEELSLDRRFVIPEARTFGLSGTARIDPNAPDATLDSVFGSTALGTTFSASSHLAGDAGARASRAFDGDGTTAWTAAVGAQAGQWLAVTTDRAHSVDRVTLQVVADGRHSVPTVLELDGDDGAKRTLQLPGIADLASPGSTQTVTIPFTPMTERSFRLEVKATRIVSADSNPFDFGNALPVSLAEVGLAGVPRAEQPTSVLSKCREDLFRVDGASVPVRVVGPVGEARSGLALESCAGPLSLRAGSNTVRAEAGLDTGVDVDRAVLSSSARGTGTSVAPRGARLSGGGASVRSVDSSSTSVNVKVKTDGRPFVLVLGQSHSDGWKASLSDGSVSSSQLVNGYANGFLVRPDRAGSITVALRWAPQRYVWLGLWVSAFAVILCLAIVVTTTVRTTRKRAQARAATLLDPPLPAQPFADTNWPPASWPIAVAAATGVALITFAFSRPWIGIVGGLAVLVAARAPRLRVAVDVAIPLLLAASRLFESPELAWLAVALLVTDLVVRGLHGAAARHTRRARRDLMP